MLFFNVHRNSKGFTLLELLIVMVFIGILVAISAPSFKGIYDKAKLNDALSTLKGVLQQNQRESLRRNRACVTAITTKNQSPISSISSNCSLFSDSVITVKYPAAVGATSISVNQLPVAISNGTTLVFSGGATVVVAQDAAVGSTSISTSTVSTAITSGELASIQNFPNQVAIATNINSNPPLINFSFRGNTTISASPNPGIIVFYLSQQPAVEKKCLTVSSGIGIIKLGIYNDATFSSTSSVTPSNCTTF